MSLTDYAENKVLDAIFQNTALSPPSLYYIGLSTTTINDDGTGATEPSGGAYARVAVPNNSAGWSAASGGVKANGTAIVFPTATASWGNISYWLASDASSGGNLWIKGSIGPAQSIGISDSARFQIGDLTISLD